MASVKEPSADHLNIYIGMLFVAAFMGYFIYNMVTSKPKLHNEQLLLSDVLDNTANAPKKMAAFHKSLDENGPFPIEPTEILSAENYVKLRRLISEQSYIEFRDRRDELMEERIMHMKQGKQKEYMASVNTAATEYRNITMKY